MLRSMRPARPCEQHAHMRCVLFDVPVGRHWSWLCHIVLKFRAEVQLQLFVCCSVNILEGSYAEAALPRRLHVVSRTEVLKQKAWWPSRDTNQA